MSWPDSWDLFCEMRQSERSDTFVCMKLAWRIVTWLALHTFHYVCPYLYLLIFSRFIMFAPSYIYLFSQVWLRFHRDIFTYFRTFHYVFTELYFVALVLQATLSNLVCAKGDYEWCFRSLSQRLKTNAGKVLANDHYSLFLNPFLLSVFANSFHLAPYNFCSWDNVIKEFKNQE
jgi:hypothetical protein